jgi:hypothetical protein
MTDMRPLGWCYDGVLHLLSGVTLEEAQGGGWQFMGEIRDSEGNVVQEVQEVPDWEDDK